MITTVCLNPSFDKTVEMDSLHKCGLNRIKVLRLDMGGKGINVAVNLKRLGSDVLCTGTMGEFGSDRMIKMLDDVGVQHCFLKVPGDIRINTKIHLKGTNGITELNEPGPVMSPEVIDRFFDLARNSCQNASFIVLTGSLPPGCPPTTYRDLILELDGKRCILDVGGSALRFGAQAAPFLIKPNLYELEKAVGEHLVSHSEIRKAAEQFIQMGVQWVVVSLGSEGAMLVTNGHAWFAPAVLVKVVSTVGAGDALVAGLIASYEREPDMLHAFQHGIAAATASIMTDEIQLNSMQSYEELIQRVNIREV